VIYKEKEKFNGLLFFSSIYEIIFVYKKVIKNKLLLMDQALGL